MGNRKIFDIILVFNEFDLVEKRIELLKNKVDKFLVYDFGDGCKNLSSDNTIHIKSPRSFLEPDFDLIFETIKFLGPKSLYIEDIIIFSKANEIPNLDALLENVQLFDIKPIVFKQKKLFWAKDKISRKFHFSSFAITYSHYITTKNLYDQLRSFKNPVPVNRLTIDCGWQLNGFQNKNDLVESLKFWNGEDVPKENLIELHRNLLDFSGVVLKEENTDLPEVFFGCESFEKTRKPENVLITQDKEYFESTNKMKVLVSKGLLLYNDGLKYSFEIPSFNFYDVDDFETSYSKNQIIKVLEIMNLLPHDIVTLHKKETLEEVTLTYQEFSEIIPSELF